MSDKDLLKPLTQNEEIRLSTASNCITLALFRPLDTYRHVRYQSQKDGTGFKLYKLWSGWPLQALNKAVDDEVFNGNIRRINQFCDDTLKIKNPSGTPYGRALVGTVARALTLGVMVPYNAMQDPLRRREVRTVGEKGKGDRMIPVSPLYKGFRRSLLKESVFTSSYVLLSAYFGNLYGRQRQCISEYVTRVMPQPLDEEKKEKYTDIAIASMKAASAGVLSTILTQPIDNAGKGLSAVHQVNKATRKAVRKGAYNAINTVILQALLMSKVHRRVLKFASAPKSSA